MLLIVTTKSLQDAIMGIVLTDDTLKKSVYVFDKNTQTVPAHGLALEVDEQGIQNPLDWSSEWPPYLLDNEIEFNKPNLIASLYFRLGMFDECINMDDVDTELTMGARIMRRLKSKSEISDQTFQFLFDTKSKARGSDYCFYHNIAIIHHYGHINMPIDHSKVSIYYQNAIKYAPDEESKAFSRYHFARFLYRRNYIPLAYNVLKAIKVEEISKYGQKTIIGALKRLTKGVGKE